MGLFNFLGKTVLFSNVYIAAIRGMDTNIIYKINSVQIGIRILFPYRFYGTRKNGPREKNLRKNGRVLGFNILITSKHSIHTPRCSTLTPRFFVSEFSGDHFSGDQFSVSHFFREPFFPGTIFPGFFPRGPFLRDSILLMQSCIFYQAFLNFYEGIKLINRGSRIR